MTRRRAAAALAIAALAVPAAAQAMSVAEFLAKTDKLKKAGKMAMMSPDVGLLQNEMKAVAAQWRAEIDGARAKGRRDMGCPPPKGAVKMKSSELIAAMEAVPPAQRASTSVKSAFYAMMAKRFPCR